MSANQQQRASAMTFIEMMATRKQNDLPHCQLGCCPEGEHLIQIQHKQIKYRRRNQMSLPKFPSLPLQLRTRIWALASQVSRTLTVDADMAGHSNDFTLTVGFYNNGAKASLVPALLHVCKEARKIAKQDYYLANGKPNLQFNGVFTKSFLFNWKKDVLYFPTPMDQAAFLYNLTSPKSPFSKLPSALEALDNLKHVMLGGDFDSRSDERASWAFCSFRHLESVVLTPEPYYSCKFWRYFYVNWTREYLKEPPLLSQMFDEKEEEDAGDLVVGSREVMSWTGKFLDKRDSGVDQSWMDECAKKKRFINEEGHKAWIVWYTRGNGIVKIFQRTEHEMKIMAGISTEPLIEENLRYLDF